MLVYTLNVSGGRNHLEIFDWATSTVDSVIFLIGSAYFCAGSYPQGSPHHFHSHASSPGLHKDDFRAKPSSRPSTPSHRDEDVEGLLDNHDPKTVGAMERISLLP